VGSGPQLVDLDADGRREVISGSYAARVYRWPLLETGVLGPREDLVHLAHEAFKVPHVACQAADWDGDGDLDLLVGARHGEVFLLRNTGSATKPSFGQAEQLEAGGAPLKAPHGDAGPHAADWDGDGDLDLLVGDDHGGVTLFPNVGSRSIPRLAAGEALLPERGGRFVAERCRGAELCAMRAKPWVVDWNGDARPVLLVGDFHDHRTEGQMGNEHMHGWVWLYVRKARPRGESESSGPKERTGDRRKSRHAAGPHNTIVVQVAIFASPHGAPKWGISRIFERCPRGPRTAQKWGISPGPGRLA
jgi:hypothetical protein